VATDRCGGNELCSPAAGGRGGALVDQTVPLVGQEASTAARRVRHRALDRACAGQLDAMVRDPVLLEVVGTYLLGATAAAHLTTALFDCSDARRSCSA